MFEHGLVKPVEPELGSFIMHSHVVKCRMYRSTWVHRQMSDVLFDLGSSSNVVCIVLSPPHIFELGSFIIKSFELGSFTKRARLVQNSYSSSSAFLLSRFLNRVYKRVELL